MVSLPKIRWKSCWIKTRHQFFNFVMTCMLYSGFYGAVTLLLTGMYFIFLHHGSIHDNAMNSILQGRPGMRFFPLPPGDNYNSLTIWYNRSTPQYTKAYTQELLRIINKEYIKTENVEYVHCDHDVTYQNGALQANLSAQGKFCKVYDHKYLDWGPVCTPNGNGTSLQKEAGPFKLGEDAFGFRRGTPCVMIRLNRVNLWKPSTKGLTNEKKNEYQNVGVTFRPDWEEKVKNFAKNEAYIWIYCDGLTEEDRENIGDIRYFPKQRPALPKIYFPFNAQSNYLAPFVFIQFLNPTVSVVIRIQCMAFDNNINIEQHLYSVVGTINFELLID